MVNDKDYYAILGLAPFAESVVIKAAYKALAQRYHPDKTGGSDSSSHNKMREINEAYEVLSNSEKKSTYDAQYSSRHGDFWGFEGDDLNQALESLDEDWSLACNVYPSAWRAAPW